MPSDFTLETLAAKIEYEGIDYALTDIDPERVPEEVREKLRAVQAAWREFDELLPDVDEFGDDEDFLERAADETRAIADGERDE